jgi:hypothetical protein
MVYNLSFEYYSFSPKNYVLFHIPPANTKSNNSNKLQQTQ